MAKIIFFVAIACLFGTVLGDNKEPLSAEEFKKVVGECQNLYPIEENETKNFLGNIHPDDADRLAKCYMHCFMHKTKMVNDEGKFDAQIIYDITFHRHKNEIKGDLKKTIEDCLKERNETHKCNKSYAAVKCVGDKKLW